VQMKAQKTCLTYSMSALSSGLEGSLPGNTEVNDGTLFYQLITSN
jgi:hypothetical protein